MSVPVVNQAEAEDDIDIAAGVPSRGGDASNDPNRPTAEFRCQNEASDGHYLRIIGTGRPER